MYGLPVVHVIFLESAAHYFHQQFPVVGAVLADVVQAVEMRGTDFDSGMVEEQAGPEGAALFLVTDDVLVADPKMAHYRCVNVSDQFKAAVFHGICGKQLLVFITGLGIQQADGHAVL